MTWGRAKGHREHDNGFFGTQIFISPPFHRSPLATTVFAEVTPAFARLPAPIAFAPGAIAFRTKRPNPSPLASTAACRTLHRYLNFPRRSQVGRAVPYARRPRTCDFLLKPTTHRTQKPSVSRRRRGLRVARIGVPGAGEGGRVAQPQGLAGGRGYVSRPPGVTQRMGRYHA